MSYYDANHYQSVELETRTRSASPYELVLVLYDGLLDELARARGHIEAKHYQQKGRSLEKCIKILNGLNAALDYDNGGELIVGLGQLYEYCISARGFGSVAREFFSFCSLYSRFLQSSVQVHIISGISRGVKKHLI